MASSSTSSFPKNFKYDVFLSFRGEDTRTNFIDHLYLALQQKSIYTYKDDERIKKGKRISDEIIGSIEDSKYFIVVFSKNYVSSSWCLDELVKIMECHNTTNQHTAYPVFYDVEPTDVRKQTGAVGEAFAKHEKEEAAWIWREALKQAADLAGWELKKTDDGHEAKFIKRIVEEVSLELRSINFHIDEKLVGMEARVNYIVSSLGTASDDVRMIGIWGIGGGGKTTLATSVFNKISHEFEGKSFIENVREVSNASLSGLTLLQNKVLSNVLNDQAINVGSVSEGKNMMRRMMRGRKVLLVLDDVDHIDQLEALAGEPNWFMSGSRIIITTREKQVLVAHGVEIHNVYLLSDAEAIGLFVRYAFRREILKGYEELSRQVISYAAGLPLTIKVLGSFLCGKSKLDWADALDRIKKIPLEETRKKLELSYIGLDDDYKEIFLDVATIWKGRPKYLAIQALESCGYHARIGLRVLEQKSLINFYFWSNQEYVGMHDHLEEMGRHIVRSSHPNTPNKHSRLWDNNEIEDILANDLGTEATRCLQFYNGELNPETIIKGLTKMKELHLLDVHGKRLDEIDYRGTNTITQKFLKALELLCNRKFDEVNPNFPNALRFFRWKNYPFKYLPKTFQANNLVALKMADSHIVQLWEGGEKKVLKKLKFLELNGPHLRTVDLGITPNLEALTLEGNDDHLIELYVPTQLLKLRSLNLDGVKLRMFDIGLTPNIENLVFIRCDLVEIHMSTRCLNLQSLELSNSKLRTLYLGLTPNLVELRLHFCKDLEELHMAHECVGLRVLQLEGLKLRNLDLRLSPNLRELLIHSCNDLEVLHFPCECVNLTYLHLQGLKLRTLDLRPTPNLVTLNLNSCHDLEELHMVHEFLKLTSLQLGGLKLRTLDLRLVPNLSQLYLYESKGLVELHLPRRCINLKVLHCYNSMVRTLDLGLTSNLTELHLHSCNDLEVLHMARKCVKLTSLHLAGLKLRTLDLRFVPNLSELYIHECKCLVQLHAPLRCLKNLVVLELCDCLGFYSFLFRMETNKYRIASNDYGIAELVFATKRCSSHPDNYLPDFKFTCFNGEDLFSLRKGIQKLMHVGPCVCSRFERFSRSICRLQ